MAITREHFADNLKRGTDAVRQNIARCCWNELPGLDRYFILLNCSFDRNPLAQGEVLHPDHDTPQTDARVPRTAEEVVEKLWRAGTIPEWIDITPYEIEGEILYLELRCCGRFTADEALLYHKPEGYPPFHKFGPVLPTGYRDLKRDGKFDLHCYRDRKRRPAMKRTSKSLIWVTAALAITVGVLALCWYFCGPSVLDAAEAGDLEQLKMLLKQGRSINERNPSIKFGWTPLIAAVYQRHTNVVHYLIQSGADVNIPDNRGETALMWATSSDENIDMVNDLISHGADLNAKDEMGATVLSYASSMPPKPKVLAAVRAAIARQDHGLKP